MPTILTPWRRPARLFALTGFNLTALPVAAFSFGTIIALLSLAGGLLITFILAVPIIWALFVWSRALGHVERSRVAALADVRIPDPVPPLTATSWWRRIWERVRSKVRWKEIAYHLAHLPVAAIGFALTVAAWAGSFAMVLMPFVVDELPGGSAKFWFFDLTEGRGAWAACAVGIVGAAVIAPWVTVGTARLELAMARALIGPSADAVHAAEVTKLETSRTAAVDSAESERRRIERDLHDGAQQRLVALAANLGAADAVVAHLDDEAVPGPGDG
ncbi:MAG TPA: sensor domain-containing protein, partial [Ilumatobacteraceae bacterium]|nr:sensor domain-containing protein [Ilumatobacteraceae bacterium]